MSLFDGQQKTCIAVCTPHRMFRQGERMVLDTISPLWHRHRAGLSFPSNINTFEVFCDGMEVGEARSQVAAQCLAHAPPPEFLLFLDDDIFVPSDALVKLFFRARTFPDYDIYAGVYCLKRPGLPEPLIYGENGQGPLWDWTVGDILTTESHGVRSVHMGLTLIRVSLFQKLKDAGLVHGDGTDKDDHPFFLTVHEERQLKDGRMTLQMGTEDIYMCNAAMKAGAKILVDTSVLAGHYDKSSGITYGLPMNYGPTFRAKWLGDKDRDEAATKCIACWGTGDLSASGGEPTRCSACGGTGKVQLKLALDIGAGGTRREWPGYRTYTTDIRKDTEPDYVQDTRKLNLCDDHFDLVASSHHLEHLGRWDQEMVWKEIYRITKPGGLTEHVVPNVEWAARKIADGCMDEHIVNVLYGAQESHGYERQFNSHFFCYTPAVGKALAEAAGFIDVTAESYVDNPDLGYNLIIRGKKPGGVEEKAEVVPLVESSAYDETILAELAAN